jgi:hypothetical protein
MPADIYKPELWNSFFVMVGGGVAALTGLVFVSLSIALSLNLEEMTKDATHKYRSINTLAGLTAVFVSCGLVLMPGQNHKAIGTELLILTVAGAVTLRNCSFSPSLEQSLSCTVFAKPLDSDLSRANNVS